MSTDQPRGGRSSVPLWWVYRPLRTPHRAGSAVGGGRLGLRSAAALRARFVERQPRYEQYATETEREVPVVTLEPRTREADA